METLPERDGEGEDVFKGLCQREREREKEGIAATVAVPGNHCFPPVLARRDKRSPPTSLLRNIA